MMKKHTSRALALVLVLVGLVMCLTSCMRYNITAVVDKNGTYTLTYIIAYQTSEEESVEPDLSAYDEYKKSGFTVEPYVKDGFSGVTMKKTGIKLEDPVALYDPNSTDDADVRPLFTLTDGVYTLKLEGVGMGGEDGMGATFKQAGATAEFVLTLPQKPISHNATTVSEDGKTLTWDFLTILPEVPVQCEFKLGGGAAGSTPWWIFAIAGAALLALVLIIVLAAKGKKKPAPAPVDASAPATPIDAPTATGAFCPSCGAKLPEGAKFCTGCGAKIGE